MLPAATLRRSIFLVDDHPLMREGLAKLIELESDLAVCGEAETAASAFDAVLRLRPDIVLIDLALRGESGLDLIKRLHSLDETPRMLVLSMHEEAYYAERALRAGALGYVMKRESSGRLIQAIRQILAGKIYVSEAVTGHMMGKLLGTTADGGGSLIGPLSDRELDVFRRLGRGQETRRIAEELHISLKTVQTHCAHIKEKLGIENATMLLREAVRWAENEQRG